jgi:hypothetical protein
MASEWFYTLKGQQAPAPISSAELKQLAASGQLQPTDLVWQDGMPNWMPASMVKGLFGASRLSSPELILTPEKSSGKQRPPRPAEPPSVPNLHPVVVWLLSAVTLGLFGLLYVSWVCRAYSARFPSRETDSTGRPLGRIRHPLGVLLLSYLTLGFYFSYHAASMLRECGAFLGRKDVESRIDWALMLLFPPYAVFVMFRLAEMIRGIQQQVKTPESIAVNFSWVFLNPCLLFALPLLSMAHQDALNQAWLAAP